MLSGFPVCDVSWKMSSHLFFFFLYFFKTLAVSYPPRIQKVFVFAVCPSRDTLSQPWNSRNMWGLRFSSLEAHVRHSASAAQKQWSKESENRVRKRQKVKSLYKAPSLSTSTGWWRKYVHIFVVRTSNSCEVFQIVKMKDHALTFVQR